MKGDTGEQFLSFFQRDHYQITFKPLSNNFEITIKSVFNVSRIVCDPCPAEPRFIIFLKTLDPDQLAFDKAI